MPEYWSPADIATHYGVTRAAVVQWRHQKTFPAPAFHVQNGVIPVYDAKAVRSWAHGRKKRSKLQKENTRRLNASKRSQEARRASVGAVPGTTLREVSEAVTDAESGLREAIGSGDVERVRELLTKEET